MDDALRKSQNDILRQTQDDVVEQVARYLKEHGPSGTLEISAELDLDPIQVIAALKVLKDGGEAYFERGPMPPWVRMARIYHGKDEP